ncbi:hypothetical protein HF086_009972 [Spodoptera exigua]|uniref:Thiamin pyrophosphokinase catalytic domain-containing protein n=1 Tax=Spodoptera exigua TaxID=7107 RepID=A0A922MFQ0_SPOEX|nr:hypothetical protein HF086_009972 [Spodoptera exigua]
MTTNGVKGEMVRRFSNSLCIQPSSCGTACAVKCWKWDVNQIIMNRTLNNMMYGILILNRPIPQNPEFIKRLWNKAAVRMTVDGGTKQWDKFIASLEDDLKKNIKDPDLISGDFDSITDEILEKYKNKGCKIIHTPDQNYTDFTKALMELNIHMNQAGLEVYNQPLRFGGIVSTSNTFDGSQKVTIKCSHTLLWSMKVPLITMS